MIKRCVNANENDHLIFVGSGCTGAVHKLINALNLKEPPVKFYKMDLNFNKKSFIKQSFKSTPNITF